MKLATKDLLRLATIGSVDDGKSTLIGRLLVDTRQLFDDQLDAVVARAEREGLSHLDFLRALIGEQANRRRERGIAHRIREAHFRSTKTLADFDWQFNAGNRSVRQRHQFCLPGRPTPCHLPAVGSSSRS